jgi:hypothetical protein
MVCVEAGGTWLVDPMATDQLVMAVMLLVV